jgi:ketosteroid isomerase-like protein
MSQENVTVVRRAIDAFNESNVLVGTVDPGPWLDEFCDAGVVFDMTRRGIDPDVYRGYEGFMRLRAQDSEVWETARFEVEEVVDAGDRVALFTRNTGHGRAGMELSVLVGQVITLSFGRIARWEYFGEDRQACLSAAGLAE